MSTPPDLTLRSTIDRLLEGVQIISGEWRYLYVNATAAQQSRQTVQALLGRTMMECFPGIEHTPLFVTLERVRQTRAPEQFINEFTYPDGDRRVFELRIEPVPDGLCILSLDVTERQTIERQLEQAQKMEAVGQLASGVAHDFNNLLTAILGYAELLTEQIGPDKPIGRDLHEIVLAAQRAAALTRRLLAFSRTQPIQRVPVSVNAVVTAVEPILRRLIPENIGIRTSLDPNVAAVLADPVQLEQVLLNLAINARDAMPAGGTITMQTETALVTGVQSPGLGGLTPGAYAVLTVSDTGIGIPPELQARIFEPFFTTKARGHGTGLGLAAVESIVKQLGGQIRVHSQPGEGSVFTLYLPSTTQTIVMPEPASRTGVAVGTERILLVEDDPSVRGFACLVLERHGYDVHAVDSAERAIAWLASTQPPMDLVIADVVLSGISGRVLAERLQHEHPSVRVLLMSGYVEQAEASAPSRVLLKPFTAQALLAQVRQALDDAPADR